MVVVSVSLSLFFYFDRALWLLMALGCDGERRSVMLLYLLWIENRRREIFDPSRCDGLALMTRPLVSNCAGALSFVAADSASLMTGAPISSALGWVFRLQRNTTPTQPISTLKSRVSRPLRAKPRRTESKTSRLPCTLHRYIMRGAR